MVEQLTIVAGIIAIVKAIKDNVPQVNGLVTLAVAIVLGGVAGYFHLQGLTDVFQGILLGIAAVGTVTTARSISDN